MNAICGYPSGDNNVLPNFLQPQFTFPAQPQFDANYYTDFSLIQSGDFTPQSFNNPNEITVKGLINQEQDDFSSVDLGRVKAEVEDYDLLIPHDEEEVKISEMQSTLEAAMKNVLVCLIGEYLSEAITLRQFLTKIRQCLNAPDSSPANKEVFTWMLRCMLEGGAGPDGSSHVLRMAAFLEENGMNKDDIEASSAAIKEESATGGYEYDIGEKRKRREKKSISRGLRSAPNKWSKAESQMLIRLVHENGDKSWKRIAEQLGGGKTGAQCAQHWKRVLSPQIRKGSWDDQEEELLLALVERYGQSWKNIAGEIKTRTDIQCRYQYQKSCLSRQCEWQEQEDALLIKKVAQMLHEGSGSNNPTRANGTLAVNWVEVAKFIARAKLTKIPRTALECKQRWYIARNGSHQLLSNTTSTVNTMNTGINNATTSNINSHQFHNINYNSINNNFTMVSAPYVSTAVTQSF